MTGSKIWLLGLLLLAAPVAAQPEGTGAGTGDALPTAQQVMDHFDSLYRAQSSYARVSMSIVTESWSRTLEAESWTEGEDDALIIIRSPAREAGTATLRTEEGLWNYAPRADRLMRIPSGMLSESWMGSHFTNDDLMRESEYDEDFDTELAWVDEGGTRYLLARSVPHADAAVVYTRIDFVLSADDWTPIRADYYDGESLVRTMHFRDVQEVAGRRIPMTMELIPLTEPGESTTITYQTLDLDAAVDAELFTQRGLRRAAQQ